MLKTLSSLIIVFALWLCVNSVLTLTFAQTSSGKGECKHIQTIDVFSYCHPQWPYPCSGNCNWVNYFDDHCNYSNFLTDCATVGTPTQDKYYPVPCMSDCSCDPNQPDWGGGRWSNLLPHKVSLRTMTHPLRASLQYERCHSNL